MRVFAHDEMPVRCSGCAFTEGTEAHRDDLTVLTAELCVQSGEPLFCHANAIEDKLPRGSERVCRGYIEQCARRGQQPAWKAAVAAEALRLIEEAGKGIDITDEAPARLLQAGMRTQR